MPPRTPSVPEQPRLRAGDADRDATLTVIQDAFANGRLTPSEVTERQDRALTSQFTDELYPIVADLPEARTLPARLSSVVAHAHHAGDVDAEVGSRYAILAGKNYDLEPGQTSIRTIAIMGGDTIRAARAFGPGVTVTMHVDAILGGNTVYIPSGVKVVDNSEAILGGNDVTKAARGDGSNGVLVLTGTSFLGGSTVRLDKKSR